LKKKLRERDTFEDKGVNGRIILNWICKRDRMGPRLRLIWLRVETGGGLL